MEVEHKAYSYLYVSQHKVQHQILQMMPRAGDTEWNCLLPLIPLIQGHREGWTQS